MSGTELVGVQATCSLLADAAPAQPHLALCVNLLPALLTGTLSKVPHTLRWCHQALIGVQITTEVTAFLVLCKVRQCIGLTGVLHFVFDHFIGGASALVFAAFDVGKRVHVALCLIRELIDRAGQELVRRAHCLVRLIATFLPGEHTIISLMLHFALSDHLTGCVAIWKIVEGHHFVALRFLSDRHSQATLLVVYVASSRDRVRRSRARLLVPGRHQRQ